MTQFYKEMNFPEPLPLFRRGDYEEHPKPEWKIRNPSMDKIYSSILPNQNMTYSPETKLNPASSSEGLSIHKPKNCETYKEYINWLKGKTSNLPSYVYQIQENDNGNLKFDSFFEAGNLLRVYYRENNVFDLYTRVDSNTNRHCQWFYFSTTQTKAGQTVLFNILNLNKTKCCVPQGFKPVYKSKIEEQQGNTAWNRVQGPVNYKRSTTLEPELYPKEESPDKRKKTTCYTLSFSHTFEHDSDTVYFAYSVPYTFTRLKEYLNSTEKNLGITGNLTPENTKILYKKEVLCKTIADLPVYILTITAPKTKGIRYKDRKGAFITCRVHPGETLASYIMEGFLDFLLGDSKEAEVLRSMHVFKIVPMLNPDGVMFGNSRTDLLGHDLNRQWISPRSDIHPSIFYSKKYIQMFCSERDLLIYCDFHGHAKKIGCFMYGCNIAANEGFMSWTKVRLFPKILASLSPMFDYKNCRFNVQPDKLGTSRVVIWKEFGITNSFTLETSFHGFIYGDQIRAFTLLDFYDIGEKLLRALLQYTYHIRQIEQELVITHGWLKPYKMNELAGASALDKQQKELEQRRRDARLIEIKEKAQRLSMSRQTSRQLSLSKKHIAVHEVNEALDSLAQQTEWRNLFSEDEIDQAYQNITSYKKLNDSESSGSDSSEYEDGENYSPSEEQIGEIGNIGNIEENDFTRHESKKNSMFCIRNSSLKSIQMARFNTQSLEKDRFSNTDLMKTQSFTPLNVDKMPVNDNVIPFPDIKSRNKAIHVIDSLRNTRIRRSSTIKATTYVQSSIQSKDTLMRIRSTNGPIYYFESQSSPDRSLNHPKLENSQNKSLAQSSLPKQIKHHKKFKIGLDSPEALSKQLKSFTVQCVKVQLKPKNKYESCGRLLTNYLKR